jgi:secondary thiamine-phosphate synthase enzyme
MKMVISGSTLAHTSIRLQTTVPTEFIDLTGRLQAWLDETGIRTGSVNVQSLHTTTAVILNEAERLLLADVGDLLERLTPYRGPYRHDDFSRRGAACPPDERANGHAHCRALLLGSSVAINIAGGRLQLGRWQRVLFVELDGPRTREVSVLAAGEGER